MPLVQISLEKGKDKVYLLSIIELTMNCVQEILQLPSNDRNIRLTEYENGLFFMKEPYEIIIEISLFSGRTIETKRKLYQQLTDSLQEKMSIPKENVFILLNEQPKENWGVRGGIAANDLDLGFKVEI
jgi:4-oxalocrotonate tautomerase family enzyme